MKVHMGPGCGRDRDPDMSFDSILGQDITMAPGGKQNSPICLLLTAFTIGLCRVLALPQKAELALRKSKCDACLFPSFPESQRHQMQQGV